MNLYDVLQVSGTATQEQIRTNFLRLAKTYHPDKMALCAVGDLTTTLRSATASTEKTDCIEFATLQQAYMILSDGERRRIYDAELSCRNRYSPVAARITLDELEESGVGSTELRYPCRCGDAFCITKEQLLEFTKPEIAVPCSSCSFHIVIQLR